MIDTEQQNSPDTLDLNLKIITIQQEIEHLKVFKADL